MGPWNPWLHDPGIGNAIRDFTPAMTANALLPDNVRQVAILVVGARFDAAYEIYRQIAVAEKEAMKAERLTTLVANLKPNDLSAEERVAFDFAYPLVRGGTLPEPIYPRGADLRTARDQSVDLRALCCAPSMASSVWLWMECRERSAASLIHFTLAD